MTKLSEDEIQYRMMLFHEQIAKNIRDSGLHVQGVFAARDQVGMPFNYTIGMHEKFGFELINFLLPLETAGAIFNHIFMTYSEGSGEIKADGVDDDRWATCPTRFYKCDTQLILEYPVQCFRHYDREDIPFVQLVFPDAKGKFPGEEGFNEKLSQILLYK